MITRRNAIYAMLGIVSCPIIGFTYMERIEPRWLEVKRRKLRADKSLLPPGLRMMHLSDLHAEGDETFEIIQKAVDLSIRENPDIIFLTGDYVTSHQDQWDRYSEILKLLSKQAPTFASLGNHDGGYWAGKHGGYKDVSLVQACLEKAGIGLLKNEREWLTIRNERICIVGLGDLWNSQCLPQKALDKQGWGIKPTIVLSHNPDSKDHLQPYHWQTMLSGHTHGGQLIIPFTGQTPFAPVKDQQFVQGLHIWGDRYIHVTKGVGSIAGIRLNCRPDVSLLEVV